MRFPEPVVEINTIGPEEDDAAFKFDDKNQDVKKKAEKVCVVCFIVFKAYQSLLLKLYEIMK